MAPFQTGPFALAFAPRHETIDSIVAMLESLAANPDHIAAVNSIRLGRFRRSVA